MPAMQTYPTASFSHVPVSLSWRAAFYFFLN